MWVCKLLLKGAPGGREPVHGQTSCVMLGAPLDLSPQAADAWMLRVVRSGASELRDAWFEWRAGAGGEEGKGDGSGGEGSGWRATGAA
jgi:hypothetical protein